MNKSDFIKNLESMSKEDINNLIKQKSKPIKMVSLITTYDKKEEVKHNGK